MTWRRLSFFCERGRSSGGSAAKVSFTQAHGGGCLCESFGGTMLSVQLDLLALRRPNPFRDLFLTRQATR